MNSDSPYTPPVAADPVAHRPPLPARGLRPGVVTAFGVIHLVLGGLGLLKGVVELALPFLASMLSGDLWMASPESLFGGTTLIRVDGFMSMVMAAILLTAGIKLLTRSPSALVWSNCYACISIGWKIMLAVFRALAVKSWGWTGNPSDVSENVQIGIATGLALVGMIYPVLSLIVLRRKAIGEWFSGVTGRK